MKDKEKCLVSEAIDKCNCESCIQNRKWREQQINLIIANELHKIRIEALRKSGGLI